MKTEIRIIWNGQAGRLSVSKAFKELHPIARANCLRDVIYDLTGMYNQSVGELTQPRKGGIKP